MDGISSAKAGLWQAMQQSPTPKISKSDEEFEKLGVEFLWDDEDLRIDELNDLFYRVSTPFKQLSVWLAAEYACMCRRMHADVIMR